MGKWRQGRNVPINVYEDDRPVCQCHTALDARNIVDAMNVRAALAERERKARLDEAKESDAIIKDSLEAD